MNQISFSFATVKARIINGVDESIRKWNVGTPRCTVRFSIIDENEYNGKKCRNDINVVAYGYTANEVIRLKVRVGSRLTITGKFITESYRDKEGITRYQQVVLANHIEFTENKPFKRGESDTNAANHIAPVQPSQHQKPEDSEEKSSSEKRRSENLPDKKSEPITSLHTDQKSDLVKEEPGEEKISVPKVNKHEIVKFYQPDEKEKELGLNGVSIDEIIDLGEEDIFYIPSNKE